MSKPTREQVLALADQRRLKEERAEVKRQQVLRALDGDLSVSEIASVYGMAHHTVRKIKAERGTARLGWWQTEARRGPRRRA